MNRNDFLNLIGKRSAIDKAALGEVYELVDLFPYFHSAHLLLLKGLKDNEDVKFERQLRNSALHIADREALYYLLKEETPHSVSKPAAATEIEISPEEYMEEVPDTQQTVIEIANSEQLISEIERIEASDSDEEGWQDTVNIHDDLRPGIEENDESASVILVMDGEEEGEEDKIVFMDPGFSLPEDSDLLELETEQDADYPVNEVGDAGHKTDRRQLQSELIDRFIIANPRIEPVREKVSTPAEDLSRPHVEEKEGFVTETLARIYISQGYYSKAIDIYEKLSLKFPEKSSYFAAQIEKVKEYIKK